MKKLVFVGAFPPPYGGVAIFNSFLYENLCYKEIPFEYFKVGENTKKGLPLKLKSYFKVLAEMPSDSLILESANIFLEYPTDRVSFYRGFIWLLFKKLKRNKWIKILHDGTFPQRYEKFSRMQRTFVKQTLNEAECVIVVNPILNDWLSKVIGYSNRIVEIGSMLPMRGQKAEELSIDIIKFLKIYDKVLLTIGTCDEIYGFQQIIEAFKKVKEQNAGIKIGIIAIDGNFALHDAEYEEKRKIIQSEKDVLLISQGLPHEKVMELMKKCNVFVRGVKSEGYGISRVEAILNGIPVVATDVGKTAGMNVYKFGDINALTKKINEALENGYNHEIERWKSYYDKEAETNFQILVITIKEIG